jgi:hypothetical protein
MSRLEYKAGLWGIAVKYGQKECYDCLGIFPSNLMRRFRFEEVSGSSERMFDPNRKGDYVNPARTRVHTRVREVFLCPSCYPKRKRKSYFKEILYWAVVLVVGLLFMGFIMKNSAKRQDQSSSAIVVEDQSVQSDEAPLPAIPSNSSSTSSASGSETALEAPAADNPSSFETHDAAEQTSDEANNVGGDPMVSDGNEPLPTNGPENRSE